MLLSGDVFTVEHIQHVRYDLNDGYPKPRNLIYILEMEQPSNAIIFCNTRDDTELVTAVLNRNGFDAELLNGDLPQKERERVMAKIKRGEVEFMVATDLAARGIDISDLGHVINYSLPEDPAVYLHRVGRTGRIGKKGVALNLVSGRELTTFSTLEKKYNITFEKRQMPNPEEALTMWTERHVREIKDASSGTVYEGFFALAGQLKGRPDADDLIAFMLKYFFAHHRMELAQAALAAGGSPRMESAPKPVSESSRREGGRDRERGGRERGGERGGRERGGRERGGSDRERSSHASRGPQAESARNDRAIFEGRAPAASEVTSSSPKGAGELKAPRGEGESRPRRERKPLEPAAPLPPGQARLWVNLGKLDSLDESGFKTALQSAGAPVDKVVRVELRGSYSYAFVADEDVPSFEGASGKKLGEKAIKIERARR